MTALEREQAKDLTTALVGVGGLAVAVLIFLIAYAAHVNAKIDALEKRIDEVCVQKSVYDRHNHGGAVPPEGGR